MATVISFRLEVNGQQASIRKVQELTGEIGVLEKAIENFNTSSGADIEKATEKYKGLKAELEEIRAKLSSKKRAPLIDPDGPAKAIPVIKSLEEQLEKVKKETRGAASELRILTRIAKENAGDQSELYQDTIKRVGELKAEQKEVTREIQRQTAAFEEQNFDPGSYRQLQATLGRLRGEFRDLGEEARESLGGRELLSKIQSTEKRLSKLDNKMGLYFRNVGNYRDAIRGLNRAFQALSAISLAGIGGREIIEQNAKISDSISDVRKTTGLSRASLKGYNDIIEELGENLKQVDTRTSLADLLDISRVGGQLGIVDDLVKKYEALRDAGDEAGAALVLEETREGLENFTIAVDKVNVALGEDLDGNVDDIARGLGRLNVNLGVADQYEESSDGILAIASSINALGGSTRATEGNIFDFTTRVSPLGQAANIVASDLIGFGAAIDELGIRPEAASTAFSNFVLSLGQDTEAFASLAGTTEEEFKRILGEEGGGAQAVIKVLEGVRAAGVELNEDGEASGGGVAVLADTLERLGVGDSARAAQTIGGLAGSLDNVIDRLDKSKVAFDENTSVQEEFEEKNNNLAASIDKVKNQLLNLVTDSDFQGFVKGIIDQFSAFISRVPAFFNAIKNGFGQAIEFFDDFKVAIIGLGLAILAANKAQIISSAISLKDIAIKKAQIIATKGLAIATRLFNLVANQNPLSRFITIGLIVIGIIGGLARRFEGFRDSIQSAFKRVNEFVQELLGPFGIGIQFSINLIGLIIDAIANFGATFEGVKAAISAIVENVSGSFTSLVNRAKITGLQLRKALTFDDAKDAALQSQIDALKDANQQIEESGQNIGEVYEKARAEAIKFQKEQEAIEAQRQAQAPATSQVDQLVNSRSTIIPDPEAERKGEEEGNRFGKGKSRAELDKERKLAEDRERIRVAAAKKIRQLEIEALSDDTQRALEEVEFQSDQDLGSIEGDEDQIRQQQQLLTGKLFRAYEEIFDDAREKSLELSSEAIENVGGSQGLLPDPGVIAAAGRQVSDALANETEQLFKEQEARIVARGEAAVAGLVGTPEEVGEQSVRIQIEVERALTEISEKRSFFDQQRLDQQAVNEKKILDLQAESIEQRLTLDSTRFELEAIENEERILAQAEAEIITREEADRLLEEADQELQEKQIERELEFLNQKSALIQNDALALIENQRQIAELELGVTRDKVDRQLAEEERLTKGRQAVTQASLSTLSDFIGATQELLSQDEDNRKKYGKALKALALAEIAVNLYREIAAINAANTRFGEPFDTIIKVASISAAVIKSGVQANKVRTQEFKGGGSLDDKAVEVIEDVRYHEVVRPRRDNLFGFAERKFDSGGIIEDLPQGIFRGPSHDAGGIKLRKRNGQPVEVEGGEAFLHNGPQRYVINKRSSKKFAPLLRSMAKGGQTFDPERKAVASSINSFRGFGVKFEQGGNIATATTALLNTRSVRPSSAISEAQPGGSPDVSRELRRQNELLMENLAGVQRQVKELSEKTIEAKAFFDPAEVTRIGLAELNKE